MMLLCGECYVHNCIGFIVSRRRPSCRKCHVRFIMCPQRAKKRAPALCESCAKEELARLGQGNAAWAKDLDTDPNALWGMQTDPELFCMLIKAYWQKCGSEAAGE